MCTLHKLLSQLLVVQWSLRVQVCEFIGCCKYMEWVSFTVNIGIGQSWDKVCYNHSPAVHAYFYIIIYSIPINEPQQGHSMYVSLHSAHWQSSPGHATIWCSESESSGYQITAGPTIRGKSVLFYLYLEKYITASFILQSSPAVNSSVPSPLGKSFRLNLSHVQWYN